MAKTKEQARLKRKLSIRQRIHGTSERPRLSIFRSAKHIYAQVIDDDTGKTLVHVSTLSGDFKAGGALPPPAAKAEPKAEAKAEGDDAKPAKPAKKDGKKTSDARRIGMLIAARCKEKNVTQVVFDRNGFIYHGRVAAVASGARQGGLKF
jgi:large subunit ribosomal protein L18